MITLKKSFQNLSFLFLVTFLTSCGVLDAPIKAYKSGHTLNNKLLKKIFATPESYKLISG